MRRNFVILLAALVLVCNLLGSGDGDERAIELHLKSGRSVKGSFIRLADDAYILSCSDTGTVTVDKSTVERISYPGNSDPLVYLRRSHQSRRDSDVRQEEDLLVAHGNNILDDVVQAYIKETDFGLRVSLKYVGLCLQDLASERSVLTLLRTTEEQGQRVELAFVLSRLTPFEDVEALRAFLASEKDAVIRNHIARLVLRSATPVTTGPPQTFSRRELLEDLTAVYARRDAEERQWFARFLVELQQDERDDDVRSAALTCFSQIAQREELRDLCIAVLSRSNGIRARRTAAELLSECVDVQARERLREILPREKDDEVRRLLEDALRDRPRK